MGWSPEGYVMRAPLWAQERPLHECRSALRRAVDGALTEFEVVSVSVTPMEVSNVEGRADSEPGELVIVIGRMISAEAAGSLRESVSAVLTDAVEKADRAEESDQAAWELVRDTLRQKPA